MAVFTVKEALLNVKDPMHPKVVKKDLQGSPIQQAAQENENLANEFTGDSWKEFCKKMGLRYFGIRQSFGLSSEDVYVNYDTCAIVMYDGEKRKISSCDYVDSGGKYCDCYVKDSDLSKVYDALLHAVFPKEISPLFKELMPKEAGHFFPSRGNNDNIVWEEVSKGLEGLRTFDNSDFLDRVLTIINEKVAKDAAECSNVDVEVGQTVFRVNVQGDRSYSDTILEVISVGETLIEISKVSYTLHPNDVKHITYRADFWKNFAKAEELEPELCSFLLTVFDNVLNGDIIQAITDQKEYSGQFSFVQYENYNSIDPACILQDSRFRINYSYFMGKPTCHFALCNAKHKSDSSFAEGFYTDIFLAFVSGDYSNWVNGMRELLQFILSLEDELSDLCLCTGEVSNIFDEVKENYFRVFDFLSKHPEVCVVKGKEEEDSVDGGGVPENTPKDLGSGSKSSFLNFFR